MRVGYRIKQLLMRLTARDNAMDRATVRGVLSDGTWALFEEMPLGDQRHALAVWRSLRASGEVHPALAQAALLHDLGKARGRLTLGYRAIIVLLGGLGGEWVRRLARDAPRSWRYPFYVHLHHPEIGARRCELANCSPLTVALVRYHERGAPETAPDPAFEELLRRLRAADDAC